jgi:hypothetical protein
LVCFADIATRANQVRRAPLPLLTLAQDYLPTNRDRRKEVLDSKRNEYRECVRQYYEVALENSDAENAVLRQVNER